MRKNRGNVSVSSLMRQPDENSGRTQRGFSLLQLVFVMAIVVTMSAIALPNFVNTTRPLKIRNDANALADLVTMARMRASLKFAHVQLVCTATAPASCKMQSIQYGNAAAGWVDENQIVYLSQGVTFAIPSAITGYLPNQSPAYQGDSAQYTPLNTTNTANPEVIFNSRGLPIDVFGLVNPDYALYLKDQSGSYIAISVNLTGRPTLYRFDAPTKTFVSLNAQNLS